MEVMPGNSLVIDECTQAESRHTVGAQRHLIDARSGAVERWRRVAGRSAGPAELWIRLRNDVGLGAQIEERIGPLLGIPNHQLDVGHDARPALVRGWVAEVTTQ